MVETIFGFLNSVGFTHPLHPAMTHIPTGMVTGAFVFRFLSFLPGMKFLAKTGYHCVIFGFIGVLPAVFTGYLDWQYRYGGAVEFLIVLKIVLTVILLGLLAAIGIMDTPEDVRLDKKTLFYVLIFFVAIGLVFSGGELQYG